MRKLFKISSLAIVMSLVFSIFTFSVAEASPGVWTIDGRYHQGKDYTSGEYAWVDVTVTHNLWSNATGGTKLGTISPQRLNYPTEAWVSIDTYAGPAWLYFHSAKDLYNYFSNDMYNGTVSFYNTRTIYNYNSQPIGSLAPQTVKFKMIAFKAQTYAGPAWVRFNP